MIISDRVKNLLNKVLPLFENITFGDIIQRMQQDIEAGGGGGLPVASQAEAEAGILNDKTMTPLRVLQSIIANASGGSGSGDVIYFDPDIAATAGNRYKTIAEAASAAASLPSAVLYVHKTGAPQQVITIPAAQYDLSNVILSTTPQTIQPILSFDAGSELIGSLPIEIRNLTIENKNTVAPLHSAPAFSVVQLLNSTIKNDATATKPAIAYGVGDFGLMILDTQASPLYSEAGGSEVVRVNGTLTIYPLHIPDNSFFEENNVFTSEPAFVGTLQIESYLLNPGGYTATHTNFVDSGSDPLPINVVQKEEARVQELITARNLTAALTTPSRTINTAYVNGSKPKAVSVTVQVPFSGAEESAIANFNIQGNLTQTIRPPRITLAGYAANSNTNNPIYSMFAIVPPGATYQVTDAGSNGGLVPVILSWHEQEISL